MDRRTKLGVGGGAAIVVIGAGSFLGIAAATGGDDEPLRGDTRDRAIAAALASTGGGTVTETEIGDDGAAYEVDVKRPNGSQVEVQLDSDFKVTGSSADDDGSEAGGKDDD
jgi:hypothetical protein